MQTEIVEHNDKGLSNSQPYASFFFQLVSFFIPLAAKPILICTSTWDGFAEKLPQVKCSSLTVKYKWKWDVCSLIAGYITLFNHCLLLLSELSAASFLSESGTSCVSSSHCKMSLSQHSIGFIFGGIPLHVTTT